MHKITIPFLVLCGCLLGKFFFQNYNCIEPVNNPDLKPLLASYQSSSVEKYALGFNSLIGASIWIQLLQNSDHHPVKNNEVSWEFAQIDTITTLDPNNTRAYDFGAIFISTLRRDKTGGKLLLEKWVKKQPNYWRPWYLLGGHHFLELKDYASAAPFILKASKMARAPEWLSSLGIRLLSESGQLYQALKTSLELIPQVRNQEAISRLSLRVRSLNYKIQKLQWEEALTQHLKKHTTFPHDISELKEEVIAKSRELSSLIENEKTSEATKIFLTENFKFKLDRTNKKIISTTPEETNALENVGIFFGPN